MGGASGRARLAVIGEAPGRQEDKAGQPFVGPAGKLMDEWVQSLSDDFNHLRYEDVAFLNAVSCFPNRTPGTSEIEACRVNVHAQLAAINPEFVLVVGGVAVSSFWKNIRIGDIRGRWWGLPIAQYPDTEESQGMPPLRQRWVPAIATWHPAAILRADNNSALSLDVKSDLAQLRMALYPGAYGPWATPLCFMCGKGDKDEHWLQCDFGLGEEVDIEKAPCPPLCICRKHWLQRTGKLDQKRRKKKGEIQMETKPGLFDD